MSYVSSIGIAKHNIAIALIQKGEIQEAQRMLLECLHIAEKTGDEHLDCSVSLNLGRTYAEQTEKTS